MHFIFTKCKDFWCKIVETLYSSAFTDITLQNAFFLRSVRIFCEPFIHRCFEHYTSFFRVK